MTPEQARISAVNSDITECAWKHQRVPGALAHQFGRTFDWMRSRCREARWAVTWWPAPDDAPRCVMCSELSEASIATETRAILAVAERAVA